MGRHRGQSYPLLAKTIRELRQAGLRDDEVLQVLHFLAEAMPAPPDEEVRYARAVERVRRVAGLPDGEFQQLLDCLYDEEQAEKARQGKERSGAAPSMEVAIRGAGRFAMNRKRSRHSRRELN